MFARYSREKLRAAQSPKSLTKPNGIIARRKKHEKLEPADPADIAQAAYINAVAGPPVVLVVASQD